MSFGENTPAVYVNLFQVQVTAEGMTRIVFSDAVQGKVGTERVAIMTSVANAEMLAATIVGLLQQIRDSNEAAAATKQ